MIRRWMGAISAGRRSVFLGGIGRAVTCRVRVVFTPPGHVGRVPARRAGRYVILDGVLVAHRSVAMQSAVFIWRDLFRFRIVTLHRGQGIRSWRELSRSAPRSRRLSSMRAHSPQ